MQSLDASSHEPVTVTFAHGDDVWTQTLFIEPGTPRRQAMDTLAGAANMVLQQIWREWNEFQ